MESHCNWIRRSLLPFLDLLPRLSAFHTQAPLLLSLDQRFCHAHEHFLHVGSVLCRGLVEGCSNGSGAVLFVIATQKNHLSCNGGDFLFVHPIALVSDNAQFHLVVHILADLLQPLVDVLEGVLSFNAFDASYLIRNIVHDEHSIRTVIVGTCDCSESFLPCSIPLPIKVIERQCDLQLGCLVKRLYGPESLILISLSNFLRNPRQSC